jgi:hypothetical protein
MLSMLGSPFTILWENESSSRGNVVENILFKRLETGSNKRDGRSIFRKFQ